jgi:hypothetical protein
MIEQLGKVSQAALRALWTTTNSNHEPGFAASERR